MINHLACIMDGNRRWARTQGLKAWLGHREGAAAAKRALSFCLQHNIKHLSLYTFSVENLQRSSEEKSFIFSLLIQTMQKELDSLIKQGVRVQFIGDKSLFPKHILAACNNIEAKTSHLDTLHLYALFCYGGQQEIIAGVKKAIKAIQEGESSVDQLDTQFKNYLWLGNTPPPDLIIRTGGIKRLSNFLLFHAAYSELYFLDCMWPEITENDFINAATYFKSCQRNFGV